MDPVWVLLFTTASTALGALVAHVLTLRQGRQIAKETFEYQRRLSADEAIWAFRRDQWEVFLSKAQRRVLLYADYVAATHSQGNVTSELALVRARLDETDITSQLNWVGVSDPGFQACVQRFYDADRACIAYALSWRQGSPLSIDHMRTLARPLLDAVAELNREVPKYIFRGSDT